MEKPRHSGITREAGARRAVVGVVVIGLLALSASSGAAARPVAQSAPKLVVTTKRLPKLGRVLVNAHGLTLYMFVPDRRRKVTCVSTCAVVWPPLTIRAGTTLVARGGVEARLLGRVRDPAGGRVVTYDGWPLYTYLGDKKPGTAAGQATNLNGGLWYVLAPSGKVIKRKP